ncbi:MAG: carboxypeptidase regulatory-like domain-containing protein [Chloroflexi bacterium]|nr:carboxypeptidase regulatory-like domain-containing protein [Chloroflexota bacterium]
MSQPLATPTQAALPQPAPTKTEITGSPVRIRGGESTQVVGTVMTEGGTAATGLGIDVYFNRDTAAKGGTLVGAGTVTDGVFVVEITVPKGLAVGTYQVIAHARGDSRYGESWSEEAGSAREAPIVTSVSETLATPSRAALPQLIPTKTEITGSPVRIRGGASALVEGTVTAEGETAITGLSVDFYFNREKATTGGILIGTGTVTGGVFAVEITVPTDLVVGTYQIIAHTRGDSHYGESWSDPEVEIYAGTHVRLEGPSTARAGEPALFKGQVIQENGAPVGDAEIKVSLDGQARTLTTAADGTFELRHAFEEPGAYHVAATFGGTRFLLETSAEITVQVQPATTQINLLLLGGLVLAGMMALGAGWGLVLARRRRPAPPQGALVEGETETEESEEPVTSDDAPPIQVVAPKTPEGMLPIRRATHLTISCPQLTPPLTSVWGLGDPLIIRCVLRTERGEPVNDATVRLEADAQKSKSLTTRADGECTTEVVFESKGSIRISCAFDGTPLSLPSTAERRVRIVDYREEIVRLFNGFLARFRDGRNPLPKDASPREAEAILVGRQLVHDERALDSFIGAFEEANYSLHLVARRQYERAHTDSLRLTSPRGRHER